METGTDADAGENSSAQFATAMRGYDRAAVDDAVRQEHSRRRALQDRLDSLQHELAAMSTAGGVPSRKRVLRRALDLLADGWDDALRVTTEAEYAMGCARARAEGVAAAERANTERKCIEAERAAEAESDVMIANSREQATQILAEAHAMQDRAALAAAELIKIATDRAHDVTRQFDAAFRALLTEAETELAERQSKAEFVLETAQAQVESARADAVAILDRAQAQREAILEHARAQVLEIEASADSEVTRLQVETDRAVAELADLMLTAGGQLTAVRPGATSPMTKPDAAA